jgi:hypothetical protein
LENACRSCKFLYLRPQNMRPTLREKALATCDAKIRDKGANVGLSFYAFFRNKNDDPALLMEAAVWWIHTHQLDHFEKAVKIKQLIEHE